LEQTQADNSQESNMARVEAVDFFYLSMPLVEDIGDGSQDALVVRVTDGQFIGWGECEAAPLVSIASYICPISHSACHPIVDSVLGQKLEDPSDILAISRMVAARSQDVLQTPHTYSGIEIALWDLLGKKRHAPIWALLGDSKAHAKTPYASRLFGDTPSETLAKAREVRALGYRALKLGWGPFGKGTAEEDTDQLHAAREGLGPDARLLIDAGTIWVDDVERAAKAIPSLTDVRAEWLEEPFVSGAVDAYSALASRSGPVRLAGGEGAHNVYMAKDMIDRAGIGVVQIDSGRIGGISPSRAVATYAQERGVKYVNHTFTSFLALSASLHPYAGLQDSELCEYPVDAKPVARAITTSAIVPSEDGLIRLPDSPGLGMDVDPSAWGPYLQDVEIKIGGRVLYRTPAIG
jgi:L-alanine-DL-glutamate epimerase-like enolase superfamily enzyme